MQQSEQFMKLLNSMKDDIRKYIKQLGLKPLCNSRKRQVEWENNVGNTVKPAVVRELLRNTYEQSLPWSMSKNEMDELLNKFVQTFKQLERDFLENNSDATYEEREIRVNDLTPLDFLYLKRYGRECETSELYFNRQENEWTRILLSGSDSNAADANILRDACGKAFCEFIKKDVMPYLDEFEDLNDRVEHIPYICAPMFTGVYETVGQGQAKSSVLSRLKFTSTAMNKAFVKVQEALAGAIYHDGLTEFVHPPKLKANDRKTPCQMYIDLDKLREDYAGREGSHENLDNLINSRVKNPELIPVIQAWCYSIINAKNNSRQALWLKGSGCDGKSVFINALANCLRDLTGRKNCVESFHAKTDGEGGFNAPLAHAILLVDSDCKNNRAIQTGILHKITGGDDTKIQAKFKEGYTTTIDAKVIIGSNIWPIIDPTDRAQWTRIIPVLWNATDKQLREEGLMTEDGIVLGSADFKQVINKEMPYWLADCEKVYKKLCTTDSNIPFPKESLLNCYDIDLEDVALVIEKAGYEITKESTDFVQQPEFRQAVKDVLSMKKPDGSMPFHNTTLSQVVEHLVKSGVEVKQKRFGKVTARAYVGVKKLETEKPLKFNF